MKVKELIEVLKTFDPELEVIMSKDAEGNGYSPLSEASHGYYEPESTYHGYIISEEDLEGDGTDDCYKVCVLDPTN